MEESRQSKLPAQPNQLNHPSQSSLVGHSGLQGLPSLKPEIHQLLHRGTVIPAHPLALDAGRRLDERRQQALTRYYIASGSGGIAVGVHTTQFEIREPGIGLYGPVLRLAAEEVERARLDRPFIKVAGICGPTEQAVREAETAAALGYDLGLVNSGGLIDSSEAELIRRCEAISSVIPVFGFYLQPAVGGKRLSYTFWRELAELPGVKAIKIAPFNRYQTLDVVRAVCESSRRDEIALYTGNDDNIVADLLTVYRFRTADGQWAKKTIAGGLLGHWAVWTSKAVELLEEIIALRERGEVPSAEWLSRGVRITDANAAFFDAANGFKGCIPGIHEVLRRQGLLAGNWCLNPDEQLSPGQNEEIERVYRAYPDLNDDEFVRRHLDEWLNEA
ncbi:dihydrodipicolinate synthase family protein [Paenibacillus macerans]|uniref:dihydrodipicolinate synthase family protein n=1 Tax=Paenibacillus macerans TaxID=44252 RepID=UPI00203DD61F|nr:dihydrodipicolinate synthase family protein [Paenibacillus macerans]MCM3699380.1 dihydrodipicolinate synthase family protein [Paenibacillus macerans]